MTRDPSARLARSWDQNAANWTRAVRDGAIASREAGTDEAIVDAIVHRAPRCLLDVGCGEGWLIRRVSQQVSCDCVGIDACDALIAAARALDPAGSYRVARYEELPQKPGALGGAFDAIVFNFALLDEAAPAVLRSVLPLLSPAGAVIIQTLHPWSAAGEEPYRDGWRCEGFTAMAGEDWEPMPWFFRTLGSWHQVVRAAGLVVHELGEPLDPATQRPLSLLLTCTPAPP